MTAAEIARALAASLGGGVDKTGGQYFVRCPCHAERTGSLALRDAKVGVLVYCHGGCDRRDVIAELIRPGCGHRDPTRARASHQSVSRPHRDDTAERRALALKLWHQTAADQRRRSLRPTSANIAASHARCRATLGFLPRFVHTRPR